MAPYAEFVEILNSSSLDELIAEVQRTPAHAVVIGAHRTEDLAPLLSMAAHELPDTPVMGWAMPPRTAPSVRAGADHYLVKPLSTTSLRRVLSTLPHPLERVMVVDDDEETRLLLVRMLAAQNPSLEVVAIAGGDEALQRLKCDNYDLLLLDLVMPQVDGLQVLENIRSDSRTKTLPVIMISGQDLYESQPYCSEVVMTLSKGLTVVKALECTLAAAQALLKPRAEQHPVHQ
jgi:CheY-like chemotaxis protein